MPPALQAVLDRLWGIPLVQTDLLLLTAFVLGTAIGFERQWRQRNAGLRTNVLVAIGAAGFAAAGVRLLGGEGSTRIIGYVASGIGFLGAGVILKDGGSVRGLNTAATLWCSAAVGAFSGAGLPGEAASLTALVLAGNTLLRPLVGWVNRRPFEAGTEARYRVLVTCARPDLAAVRDLLDAELEAAHYPVQHIEIVSAGETEVEVAAILVALEADPAELDALADKLQHAPEVGTATWTASVTG